MRISSLGLVLGVVVCPLVASSADAAVIFTTGIVTETTVSGSVSFNNWGGGDVTVLGSGGRQLLTASGGNTADVTFSFSNVSFAASDFVFLFVNQTQGQKPTAQVTAIDTAAATGTAVEITNDSTTTIGFRLPFTLSSSDSSVQTVTIRFTMQGANKSIDIDALATPEPGTFALLGMGLLGASAWAYRRRKWKKKD